MARKRRPRPRTVARPPLAESSDPRHGSVTGDAAHGQLAVVHLQCCPAEDELDHGDENEEEGDDEDEEEEEVEENDSVGGKDKFNGDRPHAAPGSPGTVDTRTGVEDDGALRPQQRNEHGADEHGHLSPRGHEQNLGCDPELEGAVGYDHNRGHEHEQEHDPDHDMEYLEGSEAGNSDVAASTRSLWDYDLDYRNIHGRRYCKDYYMPNDDMEQMRLTLQHQIFLYVLEGELSLVPLQDPTHILDVGTGTGEWAIRMAEIFPDCEVVGTDISAIAETSSVPMNLFVEIEDAEDWDRMPDRYDLIHFRNMEGSFRSWRAVYDNVFYSLKPGGWMEVLDYDNGESMAHFISAFPHDAPLTRLWADVMEASRLSGREKGNAHQDPRLLMDVGFVDVRVTEFIVPITVAEETAGKIWLITVLDAVEAVFLRLLTEHMGWDADRCKEACESVARQIADMAKDKEQAKNLSVRIRVVVGRKPITATPSSMSQTALTRDTSVDLSRDGRAEEFTSDMVSP